MLQLAKILLPLAAAVLFVTAGVCCVQRTLCPQPETTAREPSRRDVLLAGAVGFVFIQALQILFVRMARANYPDVSLAQAMNWQFYGNTDARHYLDLAVYGYGTGDGFADQELMIVFFPLFPWLVRLVHLVTGIPCTVVGFLVQGPLFAAAAASLYTLAARKWNAAVATLALALLVASPGAMFYAVPMTESLFLLVSVRYVLMWERKQWGRCAVYGVLAGLCRAPGGLLLGLAGLHLIAQWRRGNRPKLPALGAMLTPAVGLGLYFGLNYAVYGKWNQYQTCQWEHWGQKMGLFTSTVRYHLEYMAAWWSSDPHSAVGLCLAAVLTIMLSMALLAAAARKLPPHWLGYGLAYLALTMGATWLLSAPRYAVGLFCLPVALALLLEKHPRATAAVLTVLAVGSLAYTWQFLHGWPIY